MKRNLIAILVLALLVLSACAPSTSAPSPASAPATTEASVPVKAGETYVLEVRGLNIAKGNSYALVVGNQLERRKTAGKDWFFVPAKSKGARGASFNYYPDRDRLSVLLLLDAAVDAKSNKATRLEVLYCRLERSSGGWSGDANYDPGLKDRSLKDGTCSLRRT